jgi:hypothetical protein
MSRRPESIQIEALTELALSEGSKFQSYRENLNQQVRIPIELNPVMILSPLKPQVIARHLHGVAHQKQSIRDRGVIPCLSRQCLKATYLVRFFWTDLDECKLPLSAENDQIVGRGQNDLPVSIPAAFPLALSSACIQACQDIFIQSINESIEKH